ncbi:MAG: fasciclin domain-containing protein [Myxococcota bacterium]
MNWHKATRTMLVAASMAFGAFACADNDQPDFDSPTVEGTTPGSISNFLATDSRFTVLATALDQAGLIDTLDAAGSFTVFAPTDAAFNALPNDFITSANFVSTGDINDLNISISTGGLATLLQAHVVAGTVTSTEVVEASSLDTLAGGDISVIFANPTPGEDVLADQGDEFAILNGRAQILQADTTLSNGVVHVIDSVFIPTAALAGAGEIPEDAFPGTLFELLNSTPLYGPFLQALRDGGDTDFLARLDSNVDADDAAVAQTLLVPAFDLASDPEDAAGSRNAARLHIFDGNVESSAIQGSASVQNGWLAELAVANTDGQLSVEGVDVLEADLRASNGIVHLINGVLTAPSSSPADILTTRGDFTTLVQALEGEDLLDTLRDETTIRTVFAPTNDALAALDGLDVSLDSDDETVGLIAEVDAAGQLDDVLLYHVSEDGVSEQLAIPNADDPMDMTPPLPMMIETLAGDNAIMVGLLNGTIALDSIIEVQGTDTIDTDMDELTAPIVVHTVGNVLIPESAAVARPEDGFPGPTSEALAYFTRLSGFSAQAATESVPFNVDGDIAFAGTLTDIFRFVAGDPSLLVAADDNPAYDGQLVDPYSIDTDADGANDANVEIQNTTAFVPVNSALPEDLDQFFFTADVMGFDASNLASYHTVFGGLESTELSNGALDTLTIQLDGDGAPTGAVGRFTVDVDVSSGVSLNGQANVILADIVTRNGVVHLIDGTLSP